MKKIWALGLAVVVLFGIVLMTVSAEETAPAFKECKVVLNEDIALKFIFKDLVADRSYTIKLTATNYEKEVTVTADKYGEACVVYDALTPAMFDLQVTATLVGYDVTSKPRSVMAYCEWALNNMALSDEVHALVADLLNYAAAAKTYLDPVNPTTANLSAVQKNLTSVVPVKIKNYKATGDQEGMEVVWKTASPVLGESVAYRFRFAASEETLVGLNFTATMAGKTFDIEGYEQDEMGYYVDFTELTPADLMEDVVMVAKNAEGQEISVSKLISLDRYTSWVRSDPAIEENRHEELCALLNATLAYAKGAEKYVQSGKQLAAEELRDINTGKLTDSDYYRLSSISIDKYDGSAYNSLFAEAMYNAAGLSVGSAGLKDKGVSTVYANLSGDYAGILVEGSLGGTSKDKYPFLAQKDFEIGDLLYAKVPISGDNNEDITYSYWTALYLGEGRFLLETWDQSDMEISYANLKNYLLSGGAIEDKNDDDEDDQIATVSPANYYFVLRPNQAAPKTLTEAKKNITRAELENALKETLWAYYSKGTWVQYESHTFNAINYTFGGYSPLGNHLNTLEDATKDTTLYTVCSNYAWCAYYETLGFPLMGYCLNPSSAYEWIFADQVLPDADGDMLCVMRWHNYPCDDEPNSGYWDRDDEDLNNNKIKHTEGVCLCCNYGSGDAFNQTDAHTAMVNWFKAYEKNLRPGDIIRLPGHVVVYAGDGWILEAGGGKYNEKYGYDSVEADGAINATRIEDYFWKNEDASFWLEKFNGGRYGTTYKVKDRNLAGICVLRPLDLLTTDDGDDDPSNDLLNLNYYHAAVEYKTDTGYETLTWQLEQDTVELAHTGYTIQPGTYTRMMFPMMNINRTVNIGAYGTAVKGSAITYTVEIRNQSNDASYCEARTKADGVKYYGEDYIGLPIMETIPANVEFVSASEGYTIKNGVLRWNIDVPAGETVQVSYTVSVTGEMGAEIVNDGGMVGYIPSNTLVNTIGGQKISDEAQAKLLAFYEAGRELWNSNDGYKISASTAQDGSVFAEQLYNVMGLSLDLPDLEDLLEMLFDREYVEIPDGTWIGHGKSAFGWMLALKDETADPDDQVWRNMVINNSYFGGHYVWTNNLDEETRRVSIPRSGDLVAGDFVICMDVLNPADDNYPYYVTDWKVIFYLGDDKYASLTADGKLSSCDGPRELASSISYDVLIGMRPSQAYKNVNQMTATGTLADLTDADKAWQASKLSTKSLVSTYKDIIAGFSDTTKVPYIDGDGKEQTRKFKTGLSMISDVYALAGLNISQSTLADISYKNLLYLLFNDVTSDNAFGREYHRLDLPVYGYEDIYNMLKFYDGDAYADKAPLERLDQLQVGDVIVLGRTIGKIEQVMIYQGGGKFLMSTESPIGGFYLGSWLETETFENFAALKAYFGNDIVDSDGKSVGAKWEGYLVLRPADGFYDINQSMLEAPPATVGRELSDEEKAIIAAITDRNKRTGTLAKVFGLYTKIGYTIPIPSNKNFSIINLFGSSNTTSTWEHSAESSSSNATKTKTEPLPRELVVADQLCFYDMIVANSWGGAWFDAKYSNALTAGSFKIGDILWIRTSKIQTWFLLYTGNGKFVAFHSNTQENTGMVDMDTVLNLWLKGKNFTYTVGGVKTEMDPVETRQYVLLRPSQILEQLDEEPAPDFVPGWIELPPMPA